MAIKAKVELENGVVLTEGYINIQKTNIYKHKIVYENGEEVNNFTAEATINLYANQTAYEQNKPPALTYDQVFKCEIDSDKNILSQAYDAVKLNEQLIISNVEDC